MDSMLFKRGNLASVAAIHDADLRVGIDFPHEPHAPRAEDAAVPVQHECRAEVHVSPDSLAVEHTARKVHAAFRRTERIREILERTLAAFVAHWTVKRVVDEEKLEDAGAGLDHLGLP